MAEQAVLNEQEHRFEIPTRGGTAVLAFQQGPTLLNLVHTEVPPADEGAGYGSTLVRTAMEYARSHHLKVVPSCPFVQRWLKRHREFDDLIVR
ncbi:MAG: N-acetyltransferase [Acidobacteriales bacterium]|nr:N-acetyltransferase [Terriglobales bacterium]